MFQLRKRAPEATSVPSNDVLEKFTAEFQAVERKLTIMSIIIVVVFAGCHFFYAAYYIMEGRGGN